MNLLRKIKINEIQPISFSKKEQQILEIIRISLTSLSHMKVGEYSTSEYKSNTYFVHKNNVVYLRLNKNKNSLFVDKNFLYQLSFNNEIKNIDLIGLVKYFFKKDLINTEARFGALAVNYIDLILNEDNTIEIPL